MRLRPALVLASVLALTFPPAGRAQSGAMTTADLLALHRVSDPQVSPDGRWVLYTVATPDLENNRLDRNLWIVPTGGGAARQVTSSGRDGGGRWSPDGRRVAFVSSRDGTPQIYTMSPNGGEAARLTSLPGGADQIVWSPDGTAMAFTSRVLPTCPDAECTARHLKLQQESKLRVRAYETLLYRHWTEWSDGLRSHLFVVPAGGGTPRDLTPGADYDVPPLQREGPHPIAFAPDGGEIAFVAVTDPIEATSTNGDIFTVATSSGRSDPVRLTSGTGFDGAPAYSPDGRWLAYRSQETAGSESDRWRLMRFDRQSRQHHEVAPGFDRSVESLQWSPDGRTIYFNAQDEGFVPVFSVPADGGTPRILTPDTYNGEFTVTPDGKTIVISRSSQQAPAALAATPVDGSEVTWLTAHNTARLDRLSLRAAEHFTFEGAGGTSIHAMLLRPAGFDPARKYPVLMVLHGGPQTMFGDTWSWRWNTQMLAAPGYAVLMINRRGSTGFGQAFTDEIRADWGGKAFEDLMLGLDSALERYPFLDGDRVAAAGASYGGYMIAWMASHANGRFKVLVSHAGVYDLESMYGATEELWFPEREFGGPPWEAQETYDRLSPDEYAGAFGRFSTPTLVVHGELDYRVPYTQGLQFFTALQRQQVPSRLVIFPDEGHWIVKPLNSQVWYGEVLAWLEKYLPR